MVEERIKANTERIVVLENSVQDLKTRLAVAERDIDEINKKLDKIETNTNKLLWLVGGFIILAVLGYVFDPSIQSVKTAAINFIGFN
jgi:hypothetical protein